MVQLQSKLATMSNNFKQVNVQCVSYEQRSLGWRLESRLEISQVLEVRTENLKSQRSRAEQFSSGAVTSSLPVSATQVRVGGV